jgi:GNAT superfamily N-acetyltransferase
VLAEAFHEDPLFAWALPDEQRRLRALPRLFTGSLRHCARHGGVIEQGDGAAVACWMPATHATIGVLDALRSGLATSPLWLGMKATRRLQAHEEPVDARMATHLGDANAYLMAVGTTTDARGTGLGRACVDAVAEAARSAGHPAVVLRTENPANVPIYEHLGFEIIDQWTVSASGLEVWAFRRPLT